MMSQVLSGEKPGYASQEERKKVTCWLHLVTAHHALSAHTSIFGQIKQILWLRQMSFLICHQK